MELGKKQSHDSSIVDSAIVTDLYQRLKSEINKNKEAMSTPTTITATTSISLSSTIQAPEVGANETWVSEEVTVDDDGCVFNAKRGSVKEEYIHETDDVTGEPSRKRIKLSVEGGYPGDEDDFLTDINVHNSGKEVCEKRDGNTPQVHTSTENLVEEMAASRVLLSLNKDPS